MKNNPYGDVIYTPHHRILPQGFKFEEYPFDEVALVLTQTGLPINPFRLMKEYKKNYTKEEQHNKDIMMCSSVALNVPRVVKEHFHRWNSVSILFETQDGFALRHLTKDDMDALGLLLTKNPKTIAWRIVYNYFKEF